MRKRFLIQFELELGEVSEDYEATDALDYVRRCLTGKEWLLIADSADNASARELAATPTFASVHLPSLKRDISLEYERAEQEARQSGHYNSIPGDVAARDSF